MDERIEHLISRKLDGELTEAESLELDKALIRCPQARDMLDGDQRIDGLAREAIRGTFQTDVSATGGPATNWPANRGRRLRWLRWSTAVAAAVALGFFGAAVFRMPGRPATLPDTLAREQVSESPPHFEASSEDVLPVGNTVDPRPLDRNVLGVFDEKSGDFYLLEMNRMPTRAPVRIHY